MPDAPLPRHLVRRVLDHLEFDGPPPTTREGLDRLYRAWCRRVPFDNLRKRIALESRAPGPLPGGEAEDFFTAWLEHGTGGTCWPTSNALYALLAACGFDARRASASMHELGEPNHGTVVVHVDGQDVIVDSSMLFDAAVPIVPGDRYERADALHPVATEPVDAAWRVSCAYSVRPDMLVFRTLDDPATLDLFLDRYEVSRETSMFNSALYARTNRDDCVITFVGSSRYFKRAEGITAEPLGSDDLRAALVDAFGYSPAILDEFFQYETPLQEAG